MRCSWRGFAASPGQQLTFIQAHARLSPANIIITSSVEIEVNQFSWLSRFTPRQNLN